MEPYYEATLEKDAYEKFGSLENLVGGRTALDFPVDEREKKLNGKASYLGKFFDNWFYFKKSVGKNGDLIDVLKIKTLNDDADKYHAEELEKGFDKNGKIDMSKFIIPGREKIRENQQDEWPQFFYNVLWKRNMKLVGTRPTKPATFMAYPRNIRKDIISEKPGFLGVHYSSWGNDINEKIRIYFDKKKNEKFVDLKYFVHIVYKKLSGKIKSR